MSLVGLKLGYWLVLNMYSIYFMVFFLVVFLKIKKVKLRSGFIFVNIFKFRNFFSGIGSC